MVSLALAQVFRVSNVLKCSSSLFVLKSLNQTVKSSEMIRAKGVGNSPYKMTSEVNVHLPFPMPVAASASECNLLTLVGAIPHAGCPKFIAEKDEPLNRTCAFLLIFAYPVIL